MKIFLLLLSFIPFITKADNGPYWVITINNVSVSKIMYGTPLHMSYTYDSTRNDSIEIRYVSNLRDNSPRTIEILNSNDSVIYRYSFKLKDGYTLPMKIDLKNLVVLSDYCKKKYFDIYMKDSDEKKKDKLTTFVFGTTRMK